MKSTLYYGLYSLNYCIFSFPVIFELLGIYKCFEHYKKFHHRNENQIIFKILMLKKKQNLSLEIAIYLLINGQISSTLEINFKIHHVSYFRWQPRQEKNIIHGPYIFIFSTICSLTPAESSFTSLSFCWNR